MLEQFDAATVAMIGRNSPLTSSLVSGDPAFAAADLSWRREAPFRPVDWRWKLAQRSLVEKMPRRAELQDPWVRRITKHLRSRHEVTKSRVSKRASYDHLLAEAAAIRFASDPLIGAELESWLLTGEPRSSVAEITGVNELVIEAYEFAFFDVRSKLDAASFIMHTVIGPGFYEGFRRDDFASLWKTVGYMRGKYMLAVTLQAFPGTRARPWPDWYPASPEKQVRLMRACRRAILARCLPRNVSSARQLRLLLQLQAAAEADFEERYGPLKPLVPPLTRATISQMLDLTKTVEPVLSSTDSVTETGAATVDLTVSCRRTGLPETLTG